IAGIGVGAPLVKGVLLSGAAAGGQDVTGVILAPAYVRIGNDGRFTGISASAVNDVRGEQHGLTIGIFNYARKLFGVQLGLINYARNNPAPFKVLPLLNVHLKK
ncbi:MAG TPA: hypothetical protein VFJ96_06970, partial [Gemmatimonadaceae bacterium]|nr:hypothetical protein [Gemmatimonadaceae bacterium]